MTNELSTEMSAIMKAFQELKGKKNLFTLPQKRIRYKQYEMLLNVLFLSNLRKLGERNTEKKRFRSCYNGESYRCIVEFNNIFYIHIG